MANTMSEFTEVLGEILDAARRYPRRVYREEGIAMAAFGTLLLPVIIPICVVFYYSIDRKYREVLNEWEEIK